MAHKFDNKNRSKLDNEERRKELPPLETLKLLGYTGDEDFADIGCGIGYFTIPAAQMAKAASKVYAMDISEEMLEDVGERASEASLGNIEKVKVGEYALKISNESVGYALLSNVFHEIDDKKRYLSEVHRIIKHGGKLAIIEWEKVEGEKGPPVEHRVSYEEALEYLNQNGFIGSMKIIIGQNYYGIIALRK